MEFYTSWKLDPNRIVYVKCVEKDTLKDIDIKGNSFLLLIITEGVAVFRVGDKVITAAAPCFACFNEKENPVLVSKKKLKSYSVYFKPVFLNINMTFDFIRSQQYGDIAQIHDMFLLKPFIYDIYFIPIDLNYLEKTIDTFRQMKASLEIQKDWYWSCRARSYFMEIIISLERLCNISEDGKIVINELTAVSIKNEILRNALLFVESHYSTNITFGDIMEAANTNHTTLIKLFKEELSVTPMDYLWKFRITVAKKHLAFTEIPLKDITIRCGFKTVQHFSRIFKEHTGKTPMQFRKQAVENRRKNIQGKDLCR